MRAWLATVPLEEQTRYLQIMCKRLGLGLVIALVAAGCSSTSSGSSGAGASSSPDTATQTIGPEGGTMNVGGATITFPKGAVASPISVTITAAGDQPEGFVVLSSVFKCEPSGTDFAQPVVMAMPFKDDGQGGTMFWSAGTDPSFNDVHGTANGAVMTANVMHFSSGFVGRKK